MYKAFYLELLLERHCGLSMASETPSNEALSNDAPSSEAPSVEATEFMWKLQHVGPIADEKKCLFWMQASAYSESE